LVRRNVWGGKVVAESKLTNLNIKKWNEEERNQSRKKPVKKTKLRKKEKSRSKEITNAFAQPSEQGGITRAAVRMFLGGDTN